MTSASENRSCPTRADGSEVLIAHRIPLATCQERQRRMYHKCFACAFRGAEAGAAGPRKLPALSDMLPKEKLPVRPAAVG